MSTDVSSRSCTCSHKLGSEFHNLHLIVSAHDWSAMFTQDREKQQHVVHAYISITDAAECM